MKFDYFLCMSDNVIVDERNFEQHKEHNILGSFFKIKKNPRKVLPGLVSKRLINKVKEEENVKKYEKRKAKEKAKKLKRQQKFYTQLPSKEVIINLREYPL